ncbi:MAG: hypothetical protein N2167_00245 [Flavobacteriales bacterium]|nr:hypothetical protein [Flavobacteriales bacterium]
MEDFSTIIYIVFIILSIVGGLFGKEKKTSSSPKKAQMPQTPKTTSNKKPANEKTLQEMMDVLKKRASQQSEYKKEPALPEESMNIFEKYETENQSLEEIIGDEDDHRNTNLRWMIVEEEKRHENRFKVDDWKQAIVISEVLGKPKALQ